MYGLNMFFRVGLGGASSGLEGPGAGLTQRSWCYAPPTVDPAVYRPFSICERCISARQLAHRWSLPLCWVARGRAAGVALCWNAATSVVVCIMHMYAWITKLLTSGR